jgi:4-hydroxy-2-oxoheptanedioate aldolase
MKLPANTFKRALKQRRQQIGLWCSLSSSIVAEILATAGFDWIVLDTEHAPNELPMVLQQLQAMQVDANTASAVVRPPWNDTVMIKRFLDVGAQNLLLPFVQNVEEAKKAVAATRYPPKGVRGVAGNTRANRYGLVTDYYATVESELGVILQAETRDAVDRIPEMAAIEGVDGIFIGPADLSASIGHLGNAGHPEAQAEIMRALELCKSANMPAGILAVNEDDARRYLDAGFTFVAVGVDQGLLTKVTRDLAKRFRAHIGRS